MLAKSTVIWTFIILAGLFLFSGPLQADLDYPSINSSATFGLGLEVDEPSEWGVNGKFWVNPVNAFQLGINFNPAGIYLLKLEFLWHDFDIFPLIDKNGGLPLYIGLGGMLQLQNSADIGYRIPVGISYMFNKRNFPVDIYIQAVPNLWLYSGGQTNFSVNGELGAHYYF